MGHAAPRGAGLHEEDAGSEQARHDDVVERVPHGWDRSRIRFGIRLVLMCCYFDACEMMIKSFEKEPYTDAPASTQKQIDKIAAGSAKELGSRKMLREIFRRSKWMAHQWA